MSSTVLRDLAVDVINTAKNSKDAKTKIFQLEQIREIVLHRQKDLLGEFIAEIFDFMVDKAVLIRKFLVKLSGELFDQDSLTTLPHLIGLFSYLLSDSNDGVLTFVARELSRLYSKIVLLIVGMSSTQAGVDPKALWTSFRALVHKMNDYTASARSDYLRSACLRLMEEQILFGIPNSTTVTDPRLARKVNDPRLKRTVQSQTSSSTSASSNGADDIPLHHAFISKNEIQREAEDLLSRAILWSNKGGPQGYPFTPFLMAVLIQVIASVGTLRPSNGINAAKAITQLISGKGNVIQQMDRVDLENMARAANRLLVASSVLNADPEGQMQKLRAAINSLDISGQDEDGKVAGKKRAAGEVEEAEIEDMSTEQRRSTIVAALEEAEATKKLMLAKAAAAADTLFQNRQEGARHVVTHSEFTEMSGDILSLQSLSFSFNTKLVSVEESGDSDGNFVACKPVSLVDGKDFSDLAIFALLKMFENYVSVLELDAKAIKSYKEVLIRTVISLTLSSLQDGSNGYMLPIVNTWGAEINPKAMHEIPTSVTLPRGLWLFISFSLQPTIFQSDHAAKSAEADTMQKVELLTNFCNKFYAFAEDVKYEGDENSMTDFKKYLYIYESTVLATFSRMMQLPSLRGFVQNFLLNLTKIPDSCLTMLKALVVSGNKGNHTDQRESTKYRGARADALHIIGLLVFGQDLEVANQCLQYLLWNCLSDDFELRSRVISLINREIIPNQEWCNEEIYHFAIQSISVAIGKEAVQMWVEQHPAPSMEDAMEVDEEAEQQDQAAMTNFSVSNSMSEIAFDNGGRFEGSFDQHLSGAKDANVKKAVHLFTQLCLGEIQLLVVFLEVFSAYTAYQEMQKAAEKPAEEEKSEVAPVAATPAKKEDTWSVLGQFKEELRVIIPAVVRSRSDMQIFDIVSKVDELSAKLLIGYILGLLHPDYTHPAKPQLIEKVYLFAGGVAPVAPPPAESSEEGVTVAAPTIMSSITLAPIKEEANFKLFIPLIGGLPGPVIEAALPRIIKIYSEDMEGLEVVFLRIIKARPPPMTKATLLVALHRINIEEHDLKTKTLMQAVAICLNNKSDFNYVVVKEALQALLQDEIPPNALMRTAILSAQSFPEIKKLVLMEIIPNLVRKAVWNTAPKLWEGVIHGAENCASSTISSKWLEPTLKSLLGVPGANLKALLKNTKNVKKPLAKYFQALPKEEREEVLSGRALKQLSTEDDELGPMMQVVEINFTDYVIDSQKKKIADELLAMTFEEKK